MFNGILDMLKNVVKSRFFALVTTYILLFSILVGRMFYLQIVKGETYDREASLQKQKICCSDKFGTTSQYQTGHL